MNIVIIDQNKIFRESLKTALAQVHGFNIVADAGKGIMQEEMTAIPVDVILLDQSLGNGACREITSMAISRWPAVKIVLLVMYEEEYRLNCQATVDVILKNSTKKEFENIIRRQVSTVISDEDDIRNGFSVHGINNET